MSSIKQTVIVLVCIIALIVGLVVARVLREPAMTPQQLALLGATVKQQSRALEDFSLLDQDGQPFTNQDLRGRWSLIFFGYTYCPDVCPTTMATLKQLEIKLQDTLAEGNTRYIMASVDPERDTPEQLADYVAHFNPEFIGLTGSVEEMAAFALDLNSMFAKVPTDESGSYLVDHSTSIVLVNPRGEFHGFLRSPHQVDNMSKALLAVIEDYR